MKMFFDVLNKLVGTAGFILMIWSKYNGADIDIWWLLIPAVLMGINIDHIVQLKEKISSVLKK